MATESVDGPIWDTADFEWDGRTGRYAALPALIDREAERGLALPLVRWQPARSPLPRPLRRLVGAIVQLLAFVS